MKPASKTGVPQYRMGRVESPPALDSAFDGADWQASDATALTYYWDRHDRTHRPRVRVRVVYDDANLYVMFTCDDQWVRSIQTEDQSPVSTDSCVEWFVEPKLGEGYFNFEFNAGGAILLYHIRPESDGSPKVTTEVETSWLRQVACYHSLPAVVDPEIVEPVTWRLAFRVPMALMEAYVGPIQRGQEVVWRGNFQKCASRTSHPHFVTWAPIPNGYSFHSPEDFGTLLFD